MISPSPEFVALQRCVAGRYSLDRELGRGGMGVVFLARDVALDRLVAIKLLPPAVAGETRVRERFLREARTAAGLSHPNIVPIHAVEEHGDLVFFVMGFVDGETLGQRIRRRGPLSLDELLRVMHEVTWALAHAHGRGIVHRDVKPDNILLEGDGERALVTDFGIAGAADPGDAQRSGAAMGTPQYMSPEQAAGEPPDARSDVYSLGVTAYFAATGRLPFEASTVAGLLAKHAGQPAPPVTGLRPLPPRLGAAIDRCLVKSPADRFQSMEALAAELGAVRSGRGVVPAAMQRFVREAEVVGLEAGSYLAGSAVAVGVLQVLKIMQGDFFGIVTAMELITLAVFGGIVGTRLAQLLARARSVLQAGYDHPSFLAALRLDEEWEQSDDAVEPRRGWAGDVLALAVTGLVMAVGFQLTSGNSTAVQMVGLLASVGAPLYAVRRLAGRLGGRRFWRRLLRGRVGRWIFRLARLGRRGLPDPLPAGGEPTVLAIGRAADQLFSALPEAHRARLAELPGVIARLEAEASVRPAAPADRRLEQAVAALESLRLDLLRLHAGSGSLGDLTENLRAAQRIGRAVDEALEAEPEPRDVPEWTPT